MTAAPAYRAPEFPTPRLDNDRRLPPFRFKNNAEVFYKHALADQWRQVGPPHGYTRHGIFVCLDNAISLWQSVTGGPLSDKWRIRYEFSQVIRYQVDPTSPTEVEIILEVNSRPCISRDYSSVPQLGNIAPQDFPLSGLNRTINEFSFLRIVTDRVTRQGYHDNPYTFTNDNLRVLIEGRFPKHHNKDIHTCCLWNQEALRLERDEGEAAQQQLSDCTATTSRHSRTLILPPEYAGDAYGEQMKLRVTIHAGIHLDIGDLPKVYEITGRPGCLFEPADALTSRYKIADRKDRTTWEAIRHSVSADRRYMDLVVLNNTTLYNRYNVAVQIDLKSIFFDPTYEMAKETKS